MEILDLYTNDRIKSGKTMVRGDNIPNGYYRMVITVCIFNSNGEMLIQQRQPFKEGWQNLWDLSVVGSATAGETSQIAAQRELYEELGYSYSFEDKRASISISFDEGFVDIYVLKTDIDIKLLNLQYEEVQNVRWATKNDIFSMIDNHTFIPYHEVLIEYLFFMYNHEGTHSIYKTKINF